MKDYKESLDLVGKTLREINKYAPGKINQVLEQEWGFDGEQFKAWQDLTMNIYYDKILCKLLKVDYNKLPKNDIKKIKVYSYLIIKEYPDFVLPKI